MSVDVGSAKGYLDLDISGFLAGLKTANSEAERYSGNIATKVGGNITKFGNGLTSAGTTLTKTVTVPLLGIGAAGLKVATNFEKGMSEVQAISGATGAELEALKNKAIELGADTAFSAGEVAEAMTEMAKAGWSSQQIIDGMSGVLAAAAASGEGLGSVSTIVADAITGFGMAASDSIKIADLLTQAANSGTIGIADLGESFKYIAPVAGAMGLSVEDVTTALSAMSMAGIKGSQAGTALRTMLTNLVNPSDQAAAAMEQLGISATNSDGSMKSLDEIVSNLRTSFDGLTEAEKAQYASILAGKTGMSGMLSLLNLTEEEYAKVAASMDNSSGVAQQTADVMQDNLQSKVEQLGGALESLAIKLAEHVLPYIRQLVEWLTTLIDKFAELDPKTQKTILKFAGIAMAAGPVLTVFGKLTSGVGSLVTAFGKLGGGFKTTAAGGAAASGVLSKIGSALSSIPPIAWIIIAIIVVLSAAFVTLWKTSEQFRDKIKGIWDEIKQLFEGFGREVVEMVNSLGYDFESFGELMKTIWLAICDFLEPVLVNVFQDIKNAISAVLGTIRATVGVFTSLLNGDWEGAWEHFKSLFTQIWDSMVNLVKNNLNAWKGMFDVVLSWFGTTWQDLWSSIKNFFINVWNSIVTWFKNVLNDIATFFTNIWNSISTFFKNMWNGISTFFKNIWEGIKNAVKVAAMFIVELIKAWFNLVTLPFRFIWENCKDTIISIWESIKAAVSNAMNAISTFISNVWNSIKAFLQPILTGIANFVSTIWNNIKNGISTAANAIKTVVTNVFNAIQTFVTNVWNGIKNAITNVWNGIKNTATNVWNGIKEAISVPINAVKTTINNVVNAIKDKFSSGFNSAKTTVTSVFDSIKNKITTAIESAREKVKAAIDKIKSFFNFKWELPKLKMPHFSIKGSFSLNPPSVPKFAVDWYKKAMSGGMILNSPTIFGYDAVSGKFLGGGEAGSETIVGTSNLMAMIRKSVTETIAPMINVVQQLARASNELGYITYNGFVRQTKVIDNIVNRGAIDGRGDTFNFYSPKPIDEIEAAKQMKKTKRELAEGF